jgi:hypothetical protein
MADSRRELVIKGAKAALLMPGKPAELAVHRHRTRPIETDALPAVVLLNGNETIIRQTAAPPIIDRELVFRAECRAEGEPVDEVLDPYLTWVEKQLTTDSAFLALVRQVEIRRVIWDQRTSKKAVAAAAVEFAVQYRTRFGDPTSLP